MLDDLFTTISDLESWLAVAQQTVGELTTKDSELQDQVGQLQEQVTGLTSQDTQLQGRLSSLALMQAILSLRKGEKNPICIKLRGN